MRDANPDSEPLALGEKADEVLKQCREEGLKDRARGFSVARGLGPGKSARTKETIMSKRTITLTDRAPVKIDDATWPLIASGSAYTGQHEFQAFDGAWIKVRRHEDGRTIVYGYSGDWDGGGRPTRENLRAGFMRSAEESVAMIQLVAEILAEAEYAGCHAAAAARECMANLPAEELV
jgi:hypothetical protein